MRRQSTKGVVLVACAAAGCFTGDGTLGKVCETSADCGPGQACRHRICGRCGDGLAQLGEVCFAPQASQTIGDGSIAPRLADVDGDDVLDLLAIGSGRASFEVRTGTGDGTFADPTTWPVQGEVVGLETGDVDADGLVDVVVATEHPFAVSVLHGVPGGRFSEARAFSLAVAPVSLSIDPPRGRVVVADAEGAVRTLDVRAGPPVERHVLQLDAALVLGTPVRRDADTRPDLPAFDPVGRVVMVLSGTAEGFEPGPSLTLESTPSAIATGDVVDDGAEEIVVASADTDEIVVLGLLAGPGVLEVAETIPTVSTPTAVAVGELDHRPGVDIAVGGAGADAVWIHPNRAEDEPFSAIIEVDGRTRDLALAPLNRDASVDLLLITDRDRAIVILADP